jgi:hypothetical protein
MSENPPNTNIETSIADRSLITKPQAVLAEKEEVTTGDIVSYRNELKLIKEDAEHTKKMVGRIENITYLGFIILILMAAGLVFSYWQFAYSDNRETKNQIFENKFKMLELEKDSKILKNCLVSNRWLNPKCFEN